MLHPDESVIPVVEHSGIARKAARPAAVRACLMGVGVSAVLLFGMGGGGVPVFAQSSPTGSGTVGARSADQEMKYGTARYHEGAFAQAAVHWMNAALKYEEGGHVKAQCQALINMAHALQSEGQIRRAQRTLQAALQLSEQTGDRLLTATILAQLGTTSQLMGKYELATEHLTKALGLAREEKKPTLVATVLNDLGNALAARGQFAEAIDVYEESRSLAVDTKQPELSATAHINGAMALLHNQQPADAQRQFDRALAETQSLQDSPIKASGLLTIGLGYQDLHAALVSRPLPGMKQEAGNARSRETGAGAQVGGNLLRQSSEAFVAAGEVATRAGDTRGQSYAWGYLGALRERERLPEEALAYSRKATLAAQRLNAPEALYQWQWQTARLLRAAGQEEEALAAYQRAVVNLKPIGHEFSVGYQGRHHSFNESVAPLFVEYEDALLRRASTVASPEGKQQLLVQVRDTVETAHAAELQDYFRDDCVAIAKTHRGTGMLPAGTAVVYPVSLPDRLELLVETSAGLKQYGVPVHGDVLTNEVRNFRRLVQDRRSENFLPSAQALYGWLIAPLQQDFAASGITTLVMIPEGPLRTIPMAALHDGREFVVNKYAVAVSPAMELTDSGPLQRTRGSALSLGVTDSVLGFPAKPGRGEEVHAVNALYGGTSLLNNQFSTPSLEQEIRNSGGGIVHVASHTEVGNNAEKSFLLAYDEKISMDRLAQMVGLLQERNQPLELLTLSACETAVGDDRAALGLSGIAVKTGARSALASLWVAEEQVVPELVKEFYRQLQDPTVSKAVALQRAQQKILSQRGTSHPSFWSAFLLINNWM